jgi:hypothetical protein
MHSASNAAGLGTATTSGQAFWNPLAAAGWSIVFTPAFGAWIVLRNWEALGDAREVLAARRWFVISLGLLGLRLLLSALSARLNTEPTLLHWTCLLFLLAWSFGAALPQARSLKLRYGGYARRGWDKVLLLAVLAGSAYCLAGVCFTWLFVAFT